MGRADEKCTRLKFNAAKRGPQRFGSIPNCNRRKSTINLSLCSGTVVSRSRTLIVENKICVLVVWTKSLVKSTTFSHIISILAFLPAFCLSRAHRRLSFSYAGSQQWDWSERRDNELFLPLKISGHITLVIWHDNWSPLCPTRILIKERAFFTILSTNTINSDVNSIFLTISDEFGSWLRGKSQVKIAVFFIAYFSEFPADLNKKEYTVLTPQKKEVFCLSNKYLALFLP